VSGPTRETSWHYSTENSGGNITRSTRAVEKQKTRNISVAINTQISELDTCGLPAGSWAGRKNSLSQCPRLTMSSGPLSALCCQTRESEFLQSFLGRSMHVPTLQLGQADARRCPRHGGFSLHCKLSRTFGPGRRETSRSLTQHFNGAGCAGRWRG
jgi:hypothetical protein